MRTITQTLKVTKFTTFVKVASVFGLVLVYSFFQNCAQTGFELSSLNLSLFSEPSPSAHYGPFNLMSANQIQVSFIQIMGLSSPSNDQINEFNRRRSLFTDLSTPQSINGPYLLSSLSLAGSVCQQAWNDPDRRGQFFSNSVPQFPEYWDHVKRLYEKLVKEPIPENLKASFETFYAEFPPNNPQALWVATCAVILGSFKNTTL